MTNEVKLTAEGRAMVQLHMKPFDSLTLEKMQFKLDTGADLTTISKRDLGVLGYSKEWIEANAVKEEHRTLTGAGGRSATAYHVRIPVSNLFGKELKNWPFYIRREDERDFPNLLGIDILTHFNFTINYDRGYLEIASALNPVIKLPMLDSQEISALRSDV